MRDLTAIVEVELEQRLIIGAAQRRLEVLEVRVEPLAEARGRVDPEQKTMELDRVQVSRQTFFTLPLIERSNQGGWK